MSIKMMNLVWGCGAYEADKLLVLLAMADHADDRGGKVFPTVRNLARKARISPRQVHRCIKDLKADGVIGRDDDFPETPNRAVAYRLNVQKLKLLNDQEDARADADGMSASQSGGGAKLAEGGLPKEGGGLPLLADNNRQSNHHLNRHPASNEADGGAKAKKTKNRTVIGDWAPSIHEREKATQFWMTHMRPDLVANIETILGHFTAHHRAAGSRMADWPSAWQTWYSRSLRDRPMAAAPRVATVAGVTIEQWMYRLRAWHLGIPDDGVSLEVPKGFWDKRWGPSPAKGAKIPPEAESEFNRRFPAGRVAAR